MTQTVETYSRRGFLYTAVTAAVMIIAGGLVVYLSAAEAIDCTRRGERVDCRFVRTFFGRVPLITRTVPNLTSARFAAHDHQNEEEPAPVTVYRIHVYGDHGDYFTVQSAEDEVRSIQERMSAMLRDPSALRFEARLTGAPRHHAWSGIVFLLGIALVPLWVLGYFFPSLRPRQPAPSRPSESDRPTGR